MNRNSWKVNGNLSAVLNAVTIAICIAIVITFPFAPTHAHLSVTSLAYLLAAGMAFGGTVMSTTRGAVDFMFSFFFFLFLAVPSYLQINAGVFPWGAQLIVRDQIDAYGVIAAAHASYLIGRSSVEHFAKPRLPKTIRTDLAASRFFSGWAFGFSFVAVIFAALAGPRLLFSVRFADGQDFTDGGFSTQFLMMARSLSLLSYVIMIYLARMAPSRRERRRNLYAVLLLTPTFLVINYPPGLPRFLLFGNFIAVSLAFVNFRKPLVKAGMAFGGGIVLLTIFPVIKLFATGTASLSDILSAASQVNISSYFLLPDFDAYMQIVSTVTYLENGGDFRYGNNFLGALLFFVPRSIWPGKPEPSGQIVADYLGYWYVNVSNPLPTEALLAFGVIGPVLFLFWLGYVLARIDLLMVRKAPFQIYAMNFFVYALWSAFIVIILRGALNAVAPMFGTGFLAYFVMNMFFKKRVVWRKFR